MSELLSLVYLVLTIFVILVPCILLVINSKLRMLITLYQIRLAKANISPPPFFRQDQRHYGLILHKLRKAQGKPE